MKHQYSSPIQASQELESRLAESVEKMRYQIGRSAALRRLTRSAMQRRKQLEAVPDEVKQWYEETEGLEDEM